MAENLEQNVSSRGMEVDAESAGDDAPEKFNDTEKPQVMHYFERCIFINVSFAFTICCCPTLSKLVYFF